MTRTPKCVPSRKYRCECGLSLMYVPEGQNVGHSELVSCPFCHTLISELVVPDPPGAPQAAPQ